MQKLLATGKYRADLLDAQERCFSAYIDTTENILTQKAISD
jgi:hypothetical protein